MLRELKATATPHLGVCGTTEITTTTSNISHDQFIAGQHAEESDHLSRWKYGSSGRKDARGAFALDARARHRRPASSYARDLGERALLE